MTELETKIARAYEVKVYYPGPYETKYAIIEYWAQSKKPLRVISYYVYGEELKTGEPIRCWHWRPSLNFNLIEENFSTEEEATARMKELRLERKNIKE